MTWQKKLGFQNLDGFRKIAKLLQIFADASEKLFMLVAVKVTDYSFFLTREFREAILFLLHQFAFVWETAAEKFALKTKNIQMETSLSRKE